MSDVEQGATITRKRVWALSLVETRTTSRARRNNTSSAFFLGDAMHKSLERLVCAADVSLGYTRVIGTGRLGKEDLSFFQYPSAPCSQSLLVCKCASLKTDHFALVFPSNDLDRIPSPPTDCHSSFLYFLSFCFTPARLPWTKKWHGYQEEPSKPSCERRWSQAIQRSY